MSTVETLMPNVAAARSSHATRAQLEEYYRQQATKKKVLAPLLKTVQGRRTGLVIDQAVRKDSDGYDDLDAFWAITPADDSTLSSLSPPRRRRRSTAVSSRVSGESSLELRLTDTPVAASAFASLEGGRRSSLALVLTETPTATYEPDETREQSPHPEKATQSEQEDVEVTEDRIVDAVKKKEDKAKAVPGDKEAEPAPGAPLPSNQSSALLVTTHAAVVSSAVAVEETLAHSMPAHTEELPEEEVDKTQEDDDDDDEGGLDFAARRLSYSARDDTDGAAVGVSESKKEDDTVAEKQPSYAPAASEPSAASSGGDAILAEEPSHTAVPAAAAASAAVIAKTNSDSVVGASAYEAAGAASGSAAGGGGGEAVVDNNGKKKKKTKGDAAGEGKRSETDAAATRRRSSRLHRVEDAPTADGATTTPPDSDGGAAAMLLRLDDHGDGSARGGEGGQVEKGREEKGEGDVGNREDAGGEEMDLVSEARDVQKQPSSVGATAQQEQQQRGDRGNRKKEAAGAADAEAQQRVNRKADAGKKDALKGSPIKAPPSPPKPRTSSPAPKKAPSPTASAIADDQDWSKGAEDTLDFSDNDGGDYGGNDYGGGYDYEEPASLAEQERDADARRKDTPPSSLSANGRRKKGASTNNGKDGKKTSTSPSKKKVKAIAPPDLPLSPVGDVRAESSSSAKKRKVIVQEEEDDDDDDDERLEQKRNERKEQPAGVEGTDERRKERVKHDLIKEDGTAAGEHGGRTHQTRASRRGGVVDMDADMSPLTGGGGVVDEEEQSEGGEQDGEEEEGESFQTTGGGKRKKPAAATKKGKGKGAKAEKKQSKDKGKPKAKAKNAATTYSSSAAMDMDDDVDHDTDPGMFEGDFDEQPNGLHTVPRGDGWHAPGIRPARMSEVARRHRRGKDQIVGGSSSRGGDDGEGEGAMGTRYPVRRRVGPLAYWKNERIHHVLRPLTDAVADVDTEHLTREAKELLKLEVPEVKEVLLAEQTPARPSRRLAKRKAMGGGGGTSHAIKKRRAEVHGPAYSLDQARADHPERRYTSKRKILCWDHTKNEMVKMRVASYREEQNIGPLVEGDGKAKPTTPVVHAGSFFSRFQAPGDKRVGYVAGGCVLPPGSVKPIESIGECQQVFWVADAEDKCLEVAYANQHTDDVDDPNAGVRLLYSAGDCFIVPSYNFYGLQNLSETADAKINWIIIKPHMENGDLVSNAEDNEEGEGAATAEGHTQEEEGEEGGAGGEGQDGEEDDANTVAQEGDDEGGDDDDGDEDMEE